jgi:methyl-accepting chemotaxis protein
MFQKLGIKAKLLMAFSLATAFLLTISGANYYFLDKVSFNFGHVAESNLPNLVLVSDMRRSILITELALFRLGTPGISETEVTELKKQINDAIEEYAKNDKDYNDVPFVEGEEPLYKASINAWNTDLEAIKKALTMVGNKGVSDPVSYYNYLNQDLVHKSQEARKANVGIMEFHQAEAKKWGGQARDQASYANRMSLILAILGGAISLGLGLLIARSVSGLLSSVIGKVEHNSQEVASASERFLQQSTTLSEGATEQAAAIQETAAAIDEVSAMIKKNSENANQSATSSAQSRNTAQEGRDTVLNMIRSIEEISESNNQIMGQVEQSNREFAEIVKVISEIGNKTKVINDIVFQTKLLSFNASVEAARAGEHGKGFAVVAEEVGNLAQMSGNAAKEISSMLEGSISRVEGIVTDTKSKVERLIQDGRGKVQAGTEVARRCGDSLEQILTAVQSVDSRVGEIASASKEQAQGVAEINTAMNQLDQTTQQSATVARQTAESSTHLARQAEELGSAVLALKAVLNGQTNEVAHRIVSAPVVKKPATVHAIGEKKPKKVMTVAQKKASGDYNMPANDDPRFEDL